jgi:hypothetical protein
MGEGGPDYRKGASLEGRKEKAHSLDANLVEGWRAKGIIQPLRSGFKFFFGVPRVGS